MTVYITGDTHGRLDLDKLFGMNFDASNMTKDDYVIIVGDFGLIWDNSPDAGHYAIRNEATLDWLDSKPWTTLFIDGNHENHDRLATYPVSTWHGGHVHFIRDSVIHLMRGEMFDIDGDLYFAMGGAMSIDRDCRIVGESWWASEIPSDEEKAHAIETLDEYGWYCDYVLTHDCPANVKFELGCRVGTTYVPDAYSEWLQYIADNLTFTRWFFGHYHEDYASVGIGGKWTALYDYVYDMSYGGWSDRVRVPRLNSFEALPESKNPRGYTLDEIADIAGVERGAVEWAFGQGMAYSTVGVDEETGETLVYKNDVFRVLDWC